MNLYPQMVIYILNWDTSYFLCLSSNVQQSPVSRQDNGDVKINITITNLSATFTCVLCPLPLATTKDLSFITLLLYQPIIVNPSFSLMREIIGRSYSKQHLHKWLPFYGKTALGH